MWWVYGLFWDTWEDDGEENNVMLGYFIKYLGQQNYCTYGNERNLLVTHFNIGIVIGTIPSEIVQLQWVRPLIWIPRWRKYSLYALRFLIGLLESCSFPGYAALLGSWYGPTQLAKRVALFEQSSAIASIFSGYLQAALFTGMNGKAGLKGWQWLFIFDAIISIPIAVWGYFAIPDMLGDARAFWLKRKDREYAVQRQTNMGRTPASKLTWKKLRKVYTGWYIWAFIFPYLMVAQAGQGSGYFNLYLKSHGYSTRATNTIPTANALSVVSSLFFGTIRDKMGTRAQTCIVVCIIVIVANILLSTWNIPTPALMFAFFLSFVSAASQPMVIVRIHISLPPVPGPVGALGTPGEILMLISCGTGLGPRSNPTQRTLTTDAPKYTYGYQILTMFGGLAIIGVLVFGVVDRWERLVSFLFSACLDIGSLTRCRKKRSERDTRDEVEVWGEAREEETRSPLRTPTTTACWKWYILMVVLERAVL
ncbi:major facilitator superfamily domain-containing protein [Aspergillus keveii]|uniref:Major facilitator superfamily domain-containing protein n=1 Tax=Aspergillus keveii TaxID=714993 RepID=A0ABR4GI06_9EURO